MLDVSDRPRRIAVPLRRGYRPTVDRVARDAPRCSEHALPCATLAAHLETFLTQREDRPLPRFVTRALRAHLECGILAHGFFRVRGPAYRTERLVPFSCKGCGFYPSCGGRRMADTAAWLVDRFLPEIPVRQWVLRFASRCAIAWRSMPSEIQGALAEFIRAVFSSLRRRARRKFGIPKPRCGADTFVQRCDDGLNLDIHLHSVVLDGMYEVCGDDDQRFPPPPPPDERLLKLGDAVDPEDLPTARSHCASTSRAWGCMPLCQFRRAIDSGLSGYADTSRGHRLQPRGCQHSTMADMCINGRSVGVMAPLISCSSRSNSLPSWQR